MKTLAWVALSVLVLAVAPTAIAADAEVENVTLNEQASMFPPAEVEVQASPRILPDGSGEELSGTDVR